MNRQPITEEQVHDEREVRIVDGLPDRTPIGYHDHPVRFVGTPEQVAANRASHWWLSDDPDEMPRCGNCDCNAWGDAHRWPCGSDVPRQITIIHH